MKQIVPKNDFIILKIHKVAEEQKGKLILSNDTATQLYEVVRCDNIPTSNFKSSIEPGSLVITNTFPRTIEVDGEKFCFTNLENIVAVVL